MIPHKIWGHHQPDVSDHPEHDGDAPDGVVAVPLLLLGHQDEPEVGQDVGAQYLSVVYLSLLVFLRSECRNTQLCGQCQLVWRNSGNCDRMGPCGNHPSWLGVRVLGPDHNSGLVMTPLDNNLAGLHQSDNTAAAAAGLLITTAQIIHFTTQFAEQFSN